MDANGPYFVSVQMPNNLASSQAWIYSLNMSTSPPTVNSLSIPTTDTDIYKKLRTFYSNTANGVNSNYLYFNKTQMYMYYNLTNRINFYNVTGNDLIY